MLEQPAAHESLPGECLLARAVLDEFDTKHESEPSDLSDQRMIAHGTTHFPLQVGPQLSDVGNHLLLIDEPKRRERSGRAHRMRRIGVAMTEQTRLRGFRLDDRPDL